MRKYLPFLLERSFPDISVEKIAKKFGLDDNIEKLGGGIFGKAYKIGNKVIKITGDEDEYYNALKLRRKPVTKYIINYYDARRVHNDYTYAGNSEYYLDFYILLMDYVVPISLMDDECMIYNRCLYMYNDIMDDYKMNDVNIFKKNFDEILKQPKYEEKIKKYSELYKISSEFFIDKLKQIHELHKEANKYNISTLDAHNNNIGMKDGHYVFYDIGCQYNGGYKKFLKDWDYEDVI